MDLIVRKCLKCGSEVKVLKDCKCEDCSIICCEEKMKELVVNSSDGAIEKHKPIYKFEDNSLIISVNHVMDIDHYIEWICLVTDNTEKYVYLKPGEKAIVTFDNVNNGTIYSYCNKHGLWKTEIE